MAADVPDGVISLSGPLRSVDSAFLVGRRHDEVVVARAGQAWRPSALSPGAGQPRPATPCGLGSQ